MAVPRRWRTTAPWRRSSGRSTEIERVVDSVDGNVVIANINSNSQAVIGGATDGGRARGRGLREAAGINAVRIPVSHAFHTSIVAPASEPLKEALRRLDVRAPGAADRRRT